MEGVVGSRPSVPTNSIGEAVENFINIMLPDGSIKKLPEGSTSFDLATSISAGLAKKVIAAQVNGVITDLQDVLHDNDKVLLIDANHPDGLDILNHSCEHLLAAAVISLFENTQVTMGPKNHSTGFYYDFDIGRPIGEEDLAKIEEEMLRLSKKPLNFTKRLVSKQEARKLFADLKQTYKDEILDWIPDEVVSIYESGHFIDLCRGPHLPNTSFIKAFKIVGVSGSYWRADSNNKMLQRINGIAFFEKKQLEDHIFRIEEAKKRDHRKLGPKHDLFFHAPEEVGPGLAMWLPHGGKLRSIIEQFSKDRHFAAGYDMVYSPHIAKSDLWRISGHLSFYKESMFAPMDVDGQEYLLKPMNCPFHALMYKHKPKSYRDLPVRLAEFGTVYRYELAGVLHGLMRVRGFTQDDAHIFCRWDQLDDELDAVLSFVVSMLKAFGFENFEVNISTRPEKFVGEEADWHNAEESLKKAVKKYGLEYNIDEGGGAFYGPKIDIKLKDCLDRLWQCSTLQLDFNNPHRFELEFVNQKGEKEQPVMLHRALFGSIERFIGILIEHYAGAFPAWFAPEQVRVLTVSDKHADHGKNIANSLQSAGLRVCFESLSNEKLGAKIRQAQLDKVPFMVIVGDKEVAENGGTLRLRSQEDKGFLPIKELCEIIKELSKQP